MDQTFQKHVRKHYHANEVEKSGIKVRKFAEDSNVHSIINEKNNSSSESDNTFVESATTPFVSVYTDQESSDDPLQFHNESHVNSQTVRNIPGNIIDSDEEESEKCNEQTSVDTEEVEIIEQIKEWVKSCQIPHEHVNKLLKILKARLLPTIPTSAEALLQSKKSGLHSVQNNFSNNVDVNVPVIDVSNIHCKSDFESFVLAQLVLQHTNMQKIENKLGTLTNILLEKKVCIPKNESASIDFKAKYNFSLPINEKHLFMIFDERLKTDMYLQNDVCTELKKHVDKVNYSISKSYLRMIRTFITKNVVMQYTASRNARQSSEIPKDIFKYTKFYECIKNVFLTARNETSLTTTNSELMSNLSDVLSNCKKWNEKN